MPAVAYNVFVPGQHGGQINNANVAKLTGGTRLTTERAVGGTMYYGVLANSTLEALRIVQQSIGVNFTEATSVFLQSNDTRQT